MSIEQTGHTAIDIHLDGIKMSVSTLLQEIDRLWEWRNSISAVVKSIPEFHTGEWAGDKEGWGYHHCVLTWLIREHNRLRSGNLTEQELNELCHNLKVDGQPVTQELVCRFKKNCEEYQKRLFGDLA